MAGRGGRGRGRGMSFNIESLGFGRGEALPGPILQPPALFPPLEFQPVPLNDGEECDYVLALKQEFRGTMRESPYFLKRHERKRDTGRYSDKYQLGQQDNQNWKPDWTRIPNELKIKSRRRSLKNVPTPNKLAKKKSENDKEIVKTLEELAKKEEKEKSGDEDEEETKEKNENDEEEEEEIYEEDELEEDTDYNLNYFDNGEDGADEDDDLDEGPIY